MSHRLRRFKSPALSVSAFLIACLLTVLAAVSPAQAVTEPLFTTPGGGTWVAPAGVTSITIECWGGGGGGGNDLSNGSGGGGGGGGGAYAKVNSFAVTPGTLYAYVVGAGGGAAAPGENSSFNGTTCVAAGGAAGTSANNGAGGAGGSAAGPTTGDVTFAGGTGSAGITAFGGGGGGSAGTSSNGNSVAGASTGATAVPEGGPGGSGGTNNNGTGPASGPGGGGGGGEYSNSTGAKTGGPGFAGQIRISYKFATTTTVTCSVGPFPYTGAGIEPCTATVTGPDGLNQSLTVTYVDNVNAGTATASASYAGNADHLPSSASATFTVDQAATTTTVTCSAGPFTYTGVAIEPCTATVTGPGLDQALAVTYANNVNAGTATASASYAGGTNYLPSSDSETFTIDKVTPTLQVTNTPSTYSGTQQEADIAATTAGTVSAVFYNDSATVPTDVGTYAIKADFTPDDTTNYNSLSGAAAGNFVIQQAATTTTVTCPAGPSTYTGVALEPCTATVTGPGLNQMLAVTYADNVNAGTATASASYAGNANYLPSSDATTFTIDKATPALQVTNSPVAYDGTQQEAIIGPSVPGTVSAILYNGSATAPTNAGNYAVTADFTPDDTANYNSLSGASAGNFVIEQAGTPTLEVTNSPVTYNGTPQAATVGHSVPGTVGTVLYNGSTTVPTNAGTYAVTADFVPDDSTNYSSLSGAAAGTFIISKAATTATVTCSAGPFTYTGAAIEPCTATVTGPGLNQALAVTYADNVNAGTATANASYAGGANFQASSDSETFTIGKAATTLQVTNSPVTYNGTSQAVAVTGSVPGTVSAVLYNGLAAVPTNAGTYAVTANFTPDDTTNYNSLSGAAAGTFVISKAATTTTVTCSAGPFPFTGSPIEPCTATVTGPGLNQALAVTYAGNVNAGTATASASYAGGANLLASSDSETFIVGEAAATLWLYMPYASRE